jgi:peptidoglycan hydrolase CwlO-like protein
MAAVGLLGMLAGVGVFAVAAPHPAYALTDQEKAALRAEYDQLQQEIAQWQQVIKDTQSKKASLQGDVTTLNAQIAQAQAKLKQLNTTITQLAGQINEKSAQISALEERIEAGQESLAKLMREVNQTETQSLVVMALSSDSLSSFFSDVADISSINKQMQELFAQLRDDRDATQKEKQALSDQKSQVADAEHSVEVQKQQVTNTQNQKKQLLAETTQQEKTYAQVLAERQAKAEAIRSALFDLRDTQGISFGTALEYAQKASQKTGVRPAFILAILSQESDLGKNIGSCLVTNLDTGDGVGKNTGTAYEKVMKSPRDTGPFQAITASVGLSWSTTPVSCPLGRTYSASRGYGGAMGPSQFIPSTWQLYASRIEAATGVSTANPWDPRDAIMATALYLSDLGAGLQTYTAERNAACKYYSGRSCDNKSPPNASYGNSVVAKADTYQQNIDYLNNPQ